MVIKSKFNRLPENVRDIFAILYDEVVWLKEENKFYLELFGNVNNLILLSELAAPAFKIINNSLISDLFISICRLSDESETWGHTNISLATLVKYDPELKKSSDLFIQLCKPIKLLRDKTIGHRDMDTTIIPLGNPFPEITYEQVNEILMFAQEYLLNFYNKFDDGGLSFTYVGRNGAKMLISWLKKGKENSKNN